tara:strand:- start:1401 stop:1991 length:591 start_codon:yes stop_codon:yes gene_type:complete
MKTYTSTPSSILVVSLIEAKLHCKIDVTTDDSLITNLISAATHLSEEYTNRFFINTDVTMVCSDWIDLDWLFKNNVTFDYSTNTIKYYAPNDGNSLTTWDSSNYNVLSEYQPTKVSLIENKSFPDIQQRPDAISITYTAGYGASASDVPQEIKQAILLTIGNWYANRESVVVGRIATELPLNVKWLLDTYKILTVS